MKHFGKIAVCIASGLVLAAGLCSSDGASSNNPYEPIVTRNIFNLNPPQAVTPTAPEPPAKITPDGIMTIFGTRQVLFKVAVPPHPPIPATQKSYILSEGQQQDDIEVQHIDEKSGVITFNNHGVMQEIPLAKAPRLTTPTPVVMHPRPQPPVRPNFGRTFNSADHTPMVNGKKLTPEEQMIMIAAEHAKAQQEHSPIANLFPPTPLDQAAGVVVPNNNSSPR